MGTTYPQDFPLAQSVSLVQMLRQNQVKSQLPQFAQNLWVIQGYVMKETIGNPAVAAIGTGNDNLLPPVLFSVKPDDFDAADALEKLNVAFASDVSPQVTVPWVLILQWVLEELVTLVAKNVQ